jgi:DegV family protein with EDD domain
MSRAGIITDSIHGLTPEMVRQYDIRVAPMGVNVLGKGYWDMVDITPAQFYAILKQMDAPGSTNAASPGQFLKIYESLGRTSSEMVYIGVSRIMTATFDNARMARQMFLMDHPGAKIELIDSQNCAGAQGFLVLEAARAAESGKSLTEIVALVQAMVPRVKYLTLTATLKYLMRMGEIRRDVTPGQVSGARPIIGITDNISGAIRIISQPGPATALDEILRLAEKLIEPGKPVHVIFHYSEDLQEAEELKQKLLSRFNCVEIYMSEYTPAALCSTGLMTGFSFYT